MGLFMNHTIEHCRYSSNEQIRTPTHEMAIWRSCSAVRVTRLRSLLVETKDDFVLGRGARGAVGVIVEPKVKLSRAHKSGFHSARLDPIQRNWQLARVELSSVVSQSCDVNCLTAHLNWSTTESLQLAISEQYSISIVHPWEMSLCW